MAEERKKWADGCTTADLPIVSRERASTWWDDYYERGRSAPNRLRLEMNADQKAVWPHDTIVEVKLSQHVYDRLEDSDTVRIYYMPESPLAFLLEDEI